jgi:glycosyltransferase involved in cell wall biosynthesis
VQAFVQAAGKDQRLRLILAGGGQQADLIHEALAPVADKVYFPGRVALDDLPGVYNAADLFVSPSHCDGSSVSLLEALACGLPALVSDIPSNQEWVTSGKTGALFRDGDADDLNRALLQMAANANLEAYGECARLLAEVRANWQVNFSMLLDAYQMALG